MDETALLEELEEANIIKIKDDRVNTNIIYTDKRQKVGEVLNYDAKCENIPKSHFQKEIPDELTKLVESDKEFVIEYLTVRQMLDVQDHDKILAAVITLSYVERGEPKSEGTPEGFTPIHGHLIKPVTSLSEKTLLYVWRPDCAPCEELRQDLGTLYSNGMLDDLNLFSVFGPENNSLLRELFEVVGAPTTLFISRGKVESRFIGAPPKNALTTEIDYFKDSS